jgi:threonylcarbamoyladenosine tRNA methylthiotransferase MtaB
LVRDAQRLAEFPVEIVLTGIHIGGYGADIESSLGSLVERLVRDVPRVRFRLSSIEATEVDDRLCELFEEPERLVPHLHAPLQSGSDRLLRRMGRHWYTASSYVAALERIVAHRGTFALGADVMSGFPSETRDDHAATVSLVNALPFTYLHVFRYSPRPGTVAERVGDSVAPVVAGARVEELRAIGDAKHAAYATARRGGDADVVVLGGRGEREGLTEDFLTVALQDPSMPRGTRFKARLESDGSRLIAQARKPIFV